MKFQDINYSLLFLLLFFPSVFSSGIAAGVINKKTSIREQFINNISNDPYRRTLGNLLLGDLTVNNHKSSLLKSSSLKATITHLVQDSIAIFDYSRGMYVPSAVKTFSYTANGIIQSSETKILNDSLALLESMLSSRTIYFTDANGSIVSATLQWMPDSINVFRTQYSPALGDSLFFFDSPNGGGYSLACKGYQSSFILSMKSNAMQKWNTTTNAWINFFVDTVISRNPSVAVYADQIWDTTSNSYRLSVIDSVFTSGTKVAKVDDYTDTKSDTTRTFSTGTYDASGNETEELQSKSQWNDALKTWQYQTKLRYVQGYDNIGNVLQSIEQDSINSWAPLDSCSRMLFSYAYDNSDFVTSRIDSIWNRSNGGIRDMHSFKYQAFSAVINPIQEAGYSQGNIFRILHNGMIETKTPVTVDIYKLSGKLVVAAEMTTSGSIWRICGNRGQRLGNGCYLAKMHGMKTAVAVWKE
jgi:hypothetical protein